MEIFAVTFIFEWPHYMKAVVLIVQDIRTSMKRIRQGVEKKDEQTIDGEELKSIEMSLGKMVQDFR